MIGILFDIIGSIITVCGLFMIILLLSVGAITLVWFSTEILKEIKK